MVWEYDDEEQNKQAHALRAMRSVRLHTAIATGSVPGKSLRDNVIPHRDSTKFYLTDFTDAYRSVQREHIQHAVDTILRKYAKYQDHKEARDTIRAYVDDGAFLPGVDGLPQGNATSQDLYNWYMFDADIALTRELRHRHRQRQYGEVATRYLDDLTVSSVSPDGLGAPVRRRIREIYTNLAPGMEVSHHKSGVRHLDSEHPAITVTGLSLCRDGRMTPSPALLDVATGVFGEMAAKLTSGELIDLHDVSLVAGYNGVLNMSGEASRSGSRRVRAMGRQAHELLHQLNVRTMDS